LFLFFFLAALPFVAPVAVDEPQSMISPFKICGHIEPGHSPNIFSPTSNFEELDDDVMGSIQHSERFLSQFFEMSEIQKIGSGTISFASAYESDNDSDGEPAMSLADEMTAMAKLIQESWTSYGDEEQNPYVTSPASPYHNISYERYGLRNE
jgi:hypothetical protein